MLLLATTALTGTLGAGDAQAACAADFCWNATSGIWSNGDNWTPGGPPSSANTVVISNGGTAIIDSTNAQSLSAGIDGNSAVIVQSGGTWTNSNASNNLTVGGVSSGSLTVNGGTLFDNGGRILLGDINTGAGSMLIENGGTVTTTGGASLGGTSTATVTLTGAGSSWNLGTGSLELENAGTTTALTVASGASLINGGTLIGGFGAAGSHNAMVVTGAGTTWQAAEIILGSVSGVTATGSLAITDGAQVTASNYVKIGFSPDTGTGFTDTITVDGSGSKLTVTGTTFDIGGAGAPGVLTVSNGGQVASVGAITVGTVAGATGTINIGAAVGQGPVAPGTISAPSIQFGAGGGTIVFNHTSSDYVFSVPISGAGGVDVENGTTILSATNSYTGATTVNGGTLDVAGAITGTSAVTVNSGGTLSGPGSITSTVSINSGGTFAPGASGVSGSATTITGSLALQSGAFYAVALNPVGATMANISGAASLAGTVEVSLAGASLAKSSTYDVLHSGGLGGTTFGGVTMPNLATSLSYSSSDVFLTVTTAQLGQTTSLNINQQNVANTLNAVFNNGGTLPAGLSSLYGLTGTNLANALSQASGELATGSQQTTFDAMGLFMGLLTDPFTSRTGGFGSTPGATGYADEGLGYAGARPTTDAFAMFTKASPAASFAQRWSVWAAGFGGSQSTDGNAALGSNNTTSNIAGTAVGADYLISPNTLAGFALAGGGTNFSVANGGTGRSDLFQMGAYVRHTSGPAYISAALAYGWQDITTNRTVTIAGSDQLRAEFNANAWSGRLEGGYRFVSPMTGGVGITPYAAAQFVTFDLPAYAEQAIAGTNNFALSYGAHDAGDARTELGIRADDSFVVPNGILTLRGRLAWAHDYDPDRSIEATFQTLPGASFVVNGAAQASDSALTTASIEMKWRSGWSAAATFEGEFSGVATSYAGKGVVRYQW